MIKPTVFIDGEAGTTGLQIYDRLSKREDITLLQIDPDKRKDPSERKKMLNQADIVFLCLPDAAAKEAVELIENPNTRVIDASTAHRTNDDWDYGFPELNDQQREKIRVSKRVANPGCYATGFISLVAPLTAAGIIPKDALLSCVGLSGYTGAGKKGIAQYETDERDPELNSPRQYGLPQHHKHVPEMMKMTNLEHAPIFNPIICDFPKGMQIIVPLHLSMCKEGTTLEKIHEVYEKAYEGEQMVSVLSLQAAEEIPSGFVASNTLADTNKLEIIVCGSEERATLIARLDNLGKGASGAAVQNMNIMLGVPEETGLNLGE